MKNDRRLKYRMFPLKLNGMSEGTVTVKWLEFLKDNVFPNFLSCVKKPFWKFGYLGFTPELASSKTFRTVIHF
jgi:hypothetical protein